MNKIKKNQLQPKFIFVTGGVISGLGKGIITASLGQLMKQRGYSISMQKLDPYVNYDAGLIHPLEHGETFVTHDGWETDLDLGHYERFIDKNLTKDSCVTTGKIYQNVITKEREGKYRGQTIQVIPHITNEIKLAIKSLLVKEKSQIGIIEIGGVVGDIESLPFLEAVRQLKNELGQENTFLIHCTWAPFLSASQEHKSKPTQQSVAILQGLGLQPNIIAVRSKTNISQQVKQKISMFCSLDYKSVVSVANNPIIYDVVNDLAKQNMDKLILKKFNLNLATKTSKQWDLIIRNIKKSTTSIKIAIVGKYKMIDAYLSMIKALEHGAIQQQVKLDINFIYSQDLTKQNYQTKLQGHHGIFVPWGFGKRAIEGKILAIKYAREHKIPFLGICYGMQLAVIEYARNALGLKGANSTEINPQTPYPVIDIIAGKTKLTKSGTLRIGAIESKIIANSKAASIYKQKTIVERHRHKFELTKSNYEKYFANSKLKIGATSLDGKLIEIIELEDHPFFIGQQAHSEFSSRPNKPSLLYNSFVEAANKKIKIRSVELF